MRVIISAAVSLDGYMDDCSSDRLVLSSIEDWEEVHRLRAECDVILVGAETVRRDDPALVIRDPELRTKRAATGKPADITKAVVTGSGNLDISLRFFTEGRNTKKIVFVREDAPAEKKASLSRVSEVVPMPEITALSIVKELSTRGFERLMVEGGPRVIKMFLDEDMADEFRLAVSPLGLDDPDAPRLPYFGNLPFEDRSKKTKHSAGNMKVYEYVINRE